VVVTHDPQFGGSGEPNVVNINLHASKTKKSQVIQVVTFSDDAQQAERGLVRLQTLSSKNVKIEGIAVRGA
jgi:hypothetical protein